MYGSAPDEPNRRNRADDAAQRPTRKSTTYSVKAYRFCHPARAALARTRL
jgi:hypothetical protein